MPDGFDWKNSHTLGLKLVRNLVEHQLAGSIDYENKKETHFTIKTKILIVEDESIIAMEIENNLQNLGYEVTAVVNTGDKAIRKAKEDQPDLV